MLYYTQEARLSAAQRITDLMAKIAAVNGDQLNYIDATATIRFLDMLKGEIIKEDKKEVQK